MVVPEKLYLTAYPNPFNSSVVFALRGVGATIRSPGQIAVEIFDITGHLVGNLPLSRTKSGDKTSGYLENRNPDLVRDPTPLTWIPDKSITSGVYLIRARVGDEVVTKKIVYLQ